MNSIQAENYEGILTSTGGFKPSDLARSQRSRRVTPTQGPYSNDLKQRKRDIIERSECHVDETTRWDLRIEDAQDVVDFVLAFVVN